MNAEYLGDAIKKAQEAAEAASPDMRAKAFEMVLAHLLATSKQGVSMRQSGSASLPAHDKTNDLRIDRIAAQLGIAEDRASELYEMRDGKLHIAVRPVGKTLADKQRNLAHVLVAGYRVGLDIKELPMTEVSEAADGWNIRDKNLGRNLKDSRLLQTRGGSGRGNRPTYSLAPNAIERVRDEIASMFNTD